MPVRSPLTAAARQCSRRPARHVVIRSQFSPIAYLRLKKPSFNQIHDRGRQRGRFFRAKAQKKIAPDGRPKRVLIISGMPTTSDGRPKRVFIIAGMPTTSDGRPKRDLKVNNAQHYESDQTVFGQLVHLAVPVFESLALFIYQEMPMRQFIDSTGLITYIIRRTRR